LIEKLRFALLTDEYLPSGTRVHSKMFHELAIELQKRGHEPIIITPGHANQKSMLFVDSYQGIEVWRFRSGRTRGVGLVMRAINERLLPTLAWIAIRREVRKNGFDICINYSPTIFFGLLAKKLRSRGAFVYLILRDMFPQWIIDQGIIGKNSPIAAIFRYYEMINYKTSNSIALQSEANLIYFKEKFPQFTNTEILMNWASEDNNFEVSSYQPIRQKLQLEGKIIFFYGGNLGRAQDMFNIIKLAHRLNMNEDIHFLLVGDGDEKELVREYISMHSLSNTTLLPSVSQGEFNKILSEIDVGLFSLSRNHTAHNFPGKILGYMSNSIPILGSINPHNDLKPLINSSGAGYVFINGEDDELYNAALTLSKDEDLRKRIGSRSKDLLLKEFSIKSAVDKILLSANSFIQVQRN